MEKKCEKCSERNTELIEYPCRRMYCFNCIYLDTLSKLNHLSEDLRVNINQYQNKSSYLSCLNRCQKCNLSVCFDRISESVETLDLDNFAKDEFKLLSELGRTFFSGLNTIFGRCLRCERISSALECYPLVCKTCVIDLVKSQTNQDLADVIYISNPESPMVYPGILEEQEMSNELHLISYRHSPRINYHFEHIRLNDRNYKRVFKVSHLDNEEYFLIARFHRNIDVSDKFVMISYPEKHDMQILLILTAIHN
jgi:hypothetical protein